jgi:hypothetical protein
MSSHISLASQYQAQGDAELKRCFMFRSFPQAAKLFLMSARYYVKGGDGVF